MSDGERHVIDPKIWTYVRLASKGNPGLLLLYAFYVDHSGESPTHIQIRDETGLNQYEIKRFREALEVANLIVVNPSGKRLHVTINEFFSITENNVLLLTSKLIDTSKKKEEERNFSYGKNSGTRFTEDDIRSDEDWQKAESILLKFFKPSRITPRDILRKNYWKRLVDLLEDESIDFEEYCRWFREKKYVRMGFNFGLFLTPSMVVEFREVQEGDTYTGVSDRMIDSEEFQNTLEKQAQRLESDFAEGVEDGQRDAF